jgi:hypothetical protein
MADRLTIINDALLATGNNPLSAEFDGSPEWLAGESAYRRAVAFILGRHRWNFATKTVALVTALPDNPSALYAYAYAQPADCLHVEALYLNDYPIGRYSIEDGRICCDHADGLKLKYLRQPDNGVWPERFVELVTMKVEAHLLRSMNEMNRDADSRDAAVERTLAEFRPLADQEEGRKAMFRSRSAARRRVGGIGRGSDWPKGRSL